MAYLKWMKKLDMKELYRKTMEEYMVYYEEQAAKVGRFDKRIEEIAVPTKYREKVKRPYTFWRIRTYTALLLVVEARDSERFMKGNTYAVCRDWRKENITVPTVSNSWRLQKQGTAI